MNDRRPVYENWSNKSNKWTFKPMCGYIHNKTLALLYLLALIYPKKFICSTEELCS